jgi:metal-dependent amidase/aminoacylase/carboxypeptidase family protein
MILVEQVKQLAQKNSSKVLAIRQHIHQNPELSFEEYNTQKYVLKQLADIGITDVTKLANTGVVALIKGKNSTQKTIALRADLDALPIIEQNDVPLNQHQLLRHLRQY